MSAVTRSDHRQPARDPLGGGKIETLPTGRKDESIADLVQKIHLPLVELFGNNLDCWSILRCARQAFYPAVDRIGRVVERLDHKQYRVAAREGDAIAGDQLLDTLAREAGRDV